MVAKLATRATMRVLMSSRGTTFSVVPSPLFSPDKKYTDLESLDQRAVSRSFPARTYQPRYNDTWNSGLRSISSKLRQGGCFYETMRDCSRTCVLRRLFRGHGRVRSGALGATAAAAPYSQRVSNAERSPPV